LLEGEGIRRSWSFTRRSISGTYLQRNRAISADESWPKSILQKDYHMSVSKKKDEQERRDGGKRRCRNIALATAWKDGTSEFCALGSRSFSEIWKRMKSLI